MPAADRAVFLYRKGVIDEGDLKAMMKPTDAEKLTNSLKRLQIEEANYKVINAKIKSETDPKRAEELKMFLNAGSTNNYELQAYLGGKLGLDKGVLAIAKKVQEENDLNKLKAKGKGSKADFENKFYVDYKSVVANRYKWIDDTTSIIQEKGVLQAYQSLDGTKVVDRSGRFRTYGLKEQADMVNLTPAKQMAIFKKSPYWATDSLSKNTKYLDKEGNFDPTILVNDKDAYEKYLLKDLVFKGMESTYEGQYSQMMQYITRHSYSYEKEIADYKKNITATATDR